MDILWGSSQNWTRFRGHFYVFSKFQGTEWGIFGVAKISNIFGVLDISDIFFFFWGGGDRVGDGSAGSKPTYG